MDLVMAESECEDCIGGLCVCTQSGSIFGRRMWSSKLTGKMGVIL